MTYNETLQFLFTKLPMYQRIGPSAFKKDLNNILKLSHALGNKYRNFPSIHVAGTNGKGSVSHMLASVLQQAGYNVGLYTSPHLKDFRERIRINGQMVSEDFVIDFTDKIRTHIDEIQPSFFEITVAMAFEAFADASVDVAVIETGLGGRLDSTNIITPVLSVITNIALDHTDMLGTTLAEIAAEKAGIIKPGIPVVIGETISETKGVFESTAKKNNSSITYADHSNIDMSFMTDLQGRFQMINKKTVLVSLIKLQELGWSISDEDIINGLASVVKNTGLRGRWEKLMDVPRVYCDTAHNHAGMLMVAENLRSLKYNRLHIVFGAAEGKDIREIIRILPPASFYLCKPDIPRGVPVDRLAAYFDDLNLHYQKLDNPQNAFIAAKMNAQTDDVIFVGGSTFVVADLLSYLED